MKIDFMYGTAWKENLTGECVFNAFKAGFRAIDTANQKKHYNEAGVGEGILKAYDDLSLSREELFLQTKFTYARGQDHRKPYDENAPYKDQVRSSFESSLNHLHTNYIDSLVLHGPFTGVGISNEDKEVWREMEALNREGLVKHIGVSNVSVEQLKEFYEFAEVKPKFAQIRCFAANMWEKDHRDFCNESNIIFQGFSLLTANRDYLGGHYEDVEERNVPRLTLKSGYGEGSLIGDIVSATQKSPAQVVFKFCHQIGILPITGTTSIENMKLNLAIDDF